MTVQRDKVRAYLARNGVNTDGYSTKGIDTRAVEVAIGNIGKRVHAARMSNDSATLETIAASLVALDTEDAQ